jgi:Na+/H+ antiporter NhaC
MATLALVSTWIGYEVSLMGDALKSAGMDNDPYAFFIEGLPYRFYPFMALAFAFAIAWTGRDFGPMRAAEARALEIDLKPDLEIPNPRRSILAILPIGMLIGVTGSSLWIQGTAAKGSTAPLFEIIGSADGYDAMLHGSIAAITTAGLLAVALRALTFRQVPEATLTAIRSLVEAMTVLFLAWAIGSAIGELHAAEYLISALGPSIPAFLLPTLVFVLSAAIAFATGTSFGTMAVIIPLAIPLAVAVTADPMLALATSAAVLSGATWGDHCSPISDTTILSSTGTGCDHGAHVATQMPYAIAAGVVSILLGTLPAGLGVNPWILLPLGCLGCWLIVRLLGKRPAAKMSA